MSTLYVVATPIGNLEDITLRAIRVLKEVDLILCEDTRETGKLLKHYGIINKMMSYHTQSKLSKIDEIIAMLQDGKDIALVSDAGTPTISDPGSLLVKRILQESEKVFEVPSGRSETRSTSHFSNLSDYSIKVVSVPGASAITAAYSISGITGGEFVFLGFLPHKKGRETLFKEMASAERPYIFYESPHRITKTLESLEKFCPSKRVFIGREITKMFEETISGNPTEVSVYLKENQEKIRGEFVVIVS